jgi:hypothetical protein
MRWSRRRGRVASCVLITLAVAGAAGAQDPARDSVPAVLVGRVTDSAGVGLTGAEVSVLKQDSLRTVTGDSGTFRMTGLPAGTIVFSVRRIGYESATFTAVLHGGRTHRATFSLTATAQRLPLVSVSDTVVSSHWLDAFDARRAREHGTFITRKDIEKRNARNGTDLVRNVPGVRVEPMGSTPNSAVSMTRGAGAQRCTPQLYVHGVAYSGTLDDFTADDIEAMEIYVGISEIPPELSRTVRATATRGGIAGPCAVIVIWTRDPRKKP